APDRRAPEAEHGSSFREIPRSVNAEAAFSPDTIRAVPPARRSGLLGGVRVLDARAPSLARTHMATPVSIPPVIPNVLAARYASPGMQQFWSAEHKILLERQLWIAVLKAQRELGVAIPAEAIEAYQRVLERIDLRSIEAREERTRHDVKARIEEFCEL